jgi:hypothetical protein
MTEIEKLRALLPHWMEHNGEHAAEFERWAETAALAGHEDAATLIRSAAQQMAQANAGLQEALEILGGPVSLHQHPHTH